MSSTSSELTKPIQFVKGVGPYLAELLRQKDVATLEDALFFLPRSYEDRSNFKPIKELIPGNRQTAFGTIRRIERIPLRSRRRSMFVMHIGDDSALLSAKWFHFNLDYMKKRYKVGMHVVFSGEVREYRHQKEMVHPDIEIIDNPQTDSLNFGRIVPVYSLTDGLYQKTLRKIMANVLKEAADHIEDPLPSAIKERQKLWGLKSSFKHLHAPSSSLPIGALFSPNNPARKRLAFDEFFFLELGLALRRRTQTREKTIPFPKSKKLAPLLSSQLPFELTAAQIKSLSQIEADLSNPYPMNRLLQGDVGSGKTVVALISALTVIEAGHQVALMAPTELLAEQHFKNLTAFLKPLKLRCALLKSDLKKSDKQKLIQEIKQGYFPLVVGTHAIIEDTVEFKNLGFVIVDEQHRFGVEQRLKLKKKGSTPHLLVMTATPIPRTLALTIYGDLDVSIMDELPKGRKPITTRVVREAQRIKLYKFMNEQLTKGRQAYVVYPLIKESEKIDLKDATQMAEHLKKIFKNFRVELLHGKLKADVKQQIMNEFKDKKIQVLVSTTVIEVGIDVPNSTIMVVEHAERFGLSQLHQLRGRIGRGAEKSYCFLLAQHRATTESVERLRAMEKYQSGFKIAEVDLQLRGPGEFLGKRQSGLPGFRVANLATDTAILLQARDEAFELISADPTLSKTEHQPLKKAIERHWQSKLNLIGAG